MLFPNSAHYEVYILSPSRTAAQQKLHGTVWSKDPSWRLELAACEKWTNPLIGWTSTADPLENVFRSGKVQFYTKEQAIGFCERQGFKYEVIDYNERTRERTKRFQGYGDNFSTKRAGMPDISSFRSNKKGG
eukprot:g5721.t1